MPAKIKASVNVSINSNAPASAAVIAEKFCRTIDITVSLLSNDLRPEQVEVDCFVDPERIGPNGQDLIIVVAMNDLMVVDADKAMASIEGHLRQQEDPGSNEQVKATILFTSLQGHSKHKSCILQLARDPQLTP